MAPHVGVVCFRGGKPPDPRRAGKKPLPSPTPPHRPADATMTAPPKRSPRRWRNLTWNDLRGVRRLLQHAERSPHDYVAVSTVIFSGGSRQERQ